MTDYSYTAKGVGAFIVFFIIGYILGLVVPPIIDAAIAGGAVESNLIKEIGQITMIIIWIAGMLIIPSYFFLKGIQTESEGEPFAQVIISVFLLLFTFLFLYKGNFMLTGLASLLETSLLSGIYWIGILLTIGFGIIGTSIATILQNLPKGQ